MSGWRRWPKSPTIRPAPGAGRSGTSPGPWTVGGCTSTSTCWIPSSFAAQGLPDVEDEPGGLTWRQLTDLVRAILDTGACVGFSIAIYDPDQDPDRTDATNIVNFVRNAFAAYRESR